MKLDSITMDKAQAREAYLQYRASVRVKGGSPEDAMLARGYRHLALGRSVIDLQAAMLAGGRGNDGWPKLAIARSDRPRVNCEMWKSGRVRFFTSDLKGEQHSFTIPGRLTEKLQAVSAENEWRTESAVAIVPNVPAPLRPAHALVNYYTLFEVEAGGWKNAPPKDPALLTHIGGFLYAVLAVWDLTPLERAVIAGTRRS